MQFFGTKLRLARIATGMTTEEAAEALNPAITRAQMHKIEVGAIYPTDSQIKQFSILFMVQESFFFSPRTRPIDESMCSF